MDIRIVKDTISVDELKKVAREFYRSMIKGAVDIEKEIAAFGGEYHIDAGNKLAELGSSAENIWGFNIRFDKPRDSWIEYTAMINIKPALANKSMVITDETVRARVKKILDEKII